jgi:hypothetical protein
MSASKQYLQKRLDSAKTKYERLIKKTYPSDRVSEHFHLGTVGGSGKPVKKLNRQRERDLDRTIDDAKEVVRLSGVIADLERRIKNADKVIVKVVKPVKVSKPRAIKPLPSVAYLDWANALMDDMEARVQVARSKMHGIEWNDEHDHYLRGEMSVYIEVQAVLIGEHFRGNETTVQQIQSQLLKTEQKKLSELEQNPTSRYLPQFCKGFSMSIKIVQPVIEQYELKKAS